MGKILRKKRFVVHPLFMFWGVRIAGEPFDHLIYHYVLSYSNCETGTTCFSESFEELEYGSAECALRAWRGAKVASHRSVEHCGSKDRSSTRVH